MSEMPIIDRAGTAEQSRLQQSRETGTPWKLWGPYLSERQWGTVREDYSENGDAWGYFSHDQARSRAYHWGEDGVAGFSDDKQRLCFALALWNGKDPILKERMFGLTNGEGNHGEDVKEYYFYIDSTPTHSYMKMLYKYPQNEFPYSDLVETNRRRGRTEAEYELLDTGVFDEDRYFDVFVEYAKETPTDILIQISVCNRGPDTAPIHVLPTLWFRNVWTWWPDVPKPSLRAVITKNGVSGIAASDAEVGGYFLYCEGKPALLFTENETNNQRIFGTPNAGPYVKDGINDFVVAGRREAVNPRLEGTKAAANYQLEVGPGQTAAIRLRLTKTLPDRDWRSLRRPFLADVGAPCARGRRVLPRSNASWRPRGRGQGHAAGVGGNAVDQAVLFLRPGQMAPGARARSGPGERPSDAEPRMGAHGQ